MSAVAIVTGLVGAGWGGLLPGLVYRYAVPWPDEQEKPPPPRGACGTCGRPLLAWWRPAWRCGQCHRRLGPPVRLTVPVSAVACGAAGLALGASAALPAFLLLATVGTLLAFVDLAVLRLPDRLVGVLFVVGAALLGGAAVVQHDGTAPLRAGLGAALCGAVYLVLALLPGSPLGFGDVKLGAVLGMYLGWQGWLAVTAGLVLAPVLNLPALLYLLAVRRAGRKTMVPYGPAMLAAGMVAAVASVAGHPAIG